MNTEQQYFDQRLHRFFDQSCRPPYLDAGMLRLELARRQQQLSIILVALASSLWLFLSCGLMMALAEVHWYLFLGFGAFIGMQVLAAMAFAGCVFSVVRKEGQLWLLEPQWPF